MVDHKKSVKEKKSSKDNTGLSTTDIINMSEEIGADWLDKQSEDKINKSEDSQKNEKKGKFSVYCFS